MLILETHPDAIEQLEMDAAELRKLWLPPPATGISEWSAEHRTLPDTSARPGPWVDDPYQVDILADISNPEVREVYFMKCTQVGWSEICNNAIGWAVDLHNMPVLMIQPTQEAAQKYCKERLDPMIEATPVLADQLVRSSSKNAGSTVRHKLFRRGASLYVASGSNSREHRSSQARFVIGDEVDAIPLAVDQMGDPMQAIKRRGDTYHDFKQLHGSTPDLPKGRSRIEKGYERSSKGRYFVRCPECDFEQPFNWRDPETGSYHLLYEKDRFNQVVPGSVRYACKGCGYLIEERWKVRMVEAGRWIHERPEIRTIRGYHLNALYSVVKDNWEDICQEWLNAQEDPELLHNFFAQRLALPYEEQGDSIEASELRKKADKMHWDRGQIPPGVGVLTAEVDVQGNRLEAQIVGFDGEGRGKLVDWSRIMGDPLQDDVWGELEEWLLRPRAFANGKTLPIAITLVDSGGQAGATDQVYRYVMPRQTASRRVFAIKGDDYLDRPGLAKESSSRKVRVKLFILATVAAKKMIFSRIGIAPERPLSIHLPDWVTDEYLDQMASEQFLTHRDSKGRLKTEWVLRGKRRNEALDLWVYALCGLWILQHILAPGAYKDLKALSDAAAEPPKGLIEPTEAAPGATLILRPRGSRSGGPKGVW